MNTKALRQKILDLAIHGKLVPQDPNDEPASVLLERIRAEKERLIKEGKIKKPKKTKAACDKPHYPYQLPEGWVWTTLGELFTLQAGKNITAKNISPTQNSEYKYPCFGGNGIRGYVVSSNRNGSYPIIGRQGALCGNVNLANGEFYATEHAVVVDYYCEIDFKWCYYTLEALNLNQYATATAQPGLAVNIINEVSIPLPPYKEQKVISEAISHWLSLIDTIGNSKEHLQTTISLTKSKILDLAIHGKLVPQDPNDEPATELLKRINPKAEITCDNPQYGKLPKGWCICRLKDIAKVITGSTPSKSNKEYYGGIFPFYKPADLDLGRHVNKASEYLTQAGKDVSRLVPSGTTAVCCIGSIGKVGFLEYEGTTNQQINCAIPSECLDNEYLYYSCSSQWFYSSLIAESSAVTISIVNKSKMGNVVMPLPPLSEQHRIVAKIEELFAQLNKIEASL